MQWGRARRASLLAGLVHAHVTEEGEAGLQIEAVADLPLIQDVAGLCDAPDVDQILKGSGGSTLVEEDGGGVSGRVKAELEMGSWCRVGRKAEAAGRTLRAMRWKLHTLTGNLGFGERMVLEIGGLYDEEAEGFGKWEVGVALAAAYHKVGGSYLNANQFENARTAFERALHLRLDMLGEQHPATASVLTSLGTTYSEMGNNRAAIKLYERALGIFEDTFVVHPNAALCMSSLGAVYADNGTIQSSKEAIKLLEKALCIYERTVGRMHRHAAEAILNMSTAYGNLKKFPKAKQLNQEALEIYSKTLGADHEKTRKVTSAPIINHDRPPSIQPPPLFLPFVLE